MRLSDVESLDVQSPTSTSSGSANGKRADDDDTRGKRHDRRGTVALVGAGPGDPDLLTVRAARLISEADSVLVDALCDPRVLELVKPDARVLDVGKEAFGPSPTQSEICALIIAEARAQRFVVRLKGGDPFVFGRGGEEALALAEEGIDVELVPGLSSALSVPALAGIPVTHRGAATSFTVLTGTTSASAKGEHSDIEERWRAAARAGGTLVFLMAVNAIERVADAVLEAGRDPNTPCAVIENGSQEGERVVTSTLERLGRDARLARVMSPAIVVIGDVVSVRAQIAERVAKHIAKNAKVNSNVPL